METCQGHGETAGKEVRYSPLSLFSELTIPPRPLLLARHELWTETFFLDSSIPWEGNRIWLKRKNSSPSHDKLSKLKVHTINKFEWCRRLTKLNFHLVILNDGLRKRIIF